MDASRVQLISKKLIKPSNQTPPHVRSYKLSLLDQFTVASYVPMALFYGAPSQQIPQILERSLSEVLNLYYPFAGRLQEDYVSVDCNDKGVSFSEVKIKCPMSEIVAGTDARVQDVVFPEGLPWSTRKEDCLLIAQLSHFDCGGIAVSVCLSHKIADGCTLSGFLADWAAVTRTLLQSPVSGDETKPCPLLTGASLIPPNCDNPPKSPTFAPPSKLGVVCRRIAFKGKSLAQLKALVAADSGVQNPTRVEIVTALLYKCAMTASTKTSSSFKPSNLVQVANTRRLIKPPVLTLVGNSYTYMDVSIDSVEEMNVSRLVRELRRAKIELQEKWRALEPNELSRAILENDQKMEARFRKDVYLCSSFCGYPSYQLDFGFGQTERSVLANVSSKDVFFLTDGRDGYGVEALVTLDEKVMSAFENEEEILTFGSTP